MARFPKPKKDGDDPESKGSGDVEKRAPRRRRRASKRRRERTGEDQIVESSADADDTGADSRAAKPPRSGGSPLTGAKGAAGKVLDPVHKAFVRVLAILGALLVGIYGVLAVVGRKLAPPAKAAGRRLAAWLQALSRLLTPVRMLLVAAIACAVLLGLSQFADYRGISIGADVYDPGISSVAPAPEVERAEAGSAHSYLFVPVAIGAIVLLLVAARTRRWQLCRLVVVIGLAAIAVAILIDRPAGLDVGTLSRDFTGVEARLLGGFWMQIFAGAGLALTAFMLGGELRREAAARAGRPAPRRERKPERSRRFARKGGGTTEGASA